MRRRDRTRTFGNFFKDPDLDDKDLREQRMKESVPWAKSPFPSGLWTAERRAERDDALEPGAPQQDDTDKEIRVAPPGDVDWIDLLLDLAVATAFANLADNTPVMNSEETVSYIAYFVLVWWIWASQVAYNVRYRQGDWFNRSCAFLQLMVLCAMAAWTNNFDITIGITAKGDAEKIADLNRTATIQGISFSQANATAFLDERLPRVNALGISAVICLSRLLMLFQYSVLMYHARKLHHRTAMTTHVVALTISTLLYLTAAVILQERIKQSDDTAVGKIILWYSAICVEIFAHFLAIWFPASHVPFPSEQLYDKSSTLFVVVLGVGLDKITGQFKFVVGQAGFGPESTTVSFSIALILIGLFILYFRGGRAMDGKETKKLIYYLIHLPLDAAVTILLRGIANLLSFVNLINTQDAIITGLIKLPDPAETPSGCDIPDAAVRYFRPLFWNIGLSFDDFVVRYTSGCQDFRADGDVPKLHARYSQIVIDTVVFLFEQFDALPDPDSELGLELTSWRASNDSSIVNPQGVIKLSAELIESRLRPVLWFCGTAGATIMLMGLLKFTRQWPRDKWEWGMVTSRVLGGAGYALLSIFNINADKYPPQIGALTDTLKRITNPGALIWRFAASGWILPSLALLLLMLNIVDSALGFFARRSYKHQEAELVNQPERKPTIMADFLGPTVYRAVTKRQSQGRRRRQSGHLKEESLPTDTEQLLTSSPPTMSGHSPTPSMSFTSGRPVSTYDPYKGYQPGPEAQDPVPGPSRP